MTDYEKLKELYEEIDVLINTATDSSPAFMKWHTKAERFLDRRYGQSSKEVKQFSKIPFSPLVYTGFTTKNDEIAACSFGLAKAKSDFSVYLEEIEEEIESAKVNDKHKVNENIKESIPASQKKYQVFISSTYEDLKEERNAVQKLILEMGSIPIGMEQFPASNMSQMSYIEKMLKDCDYYILILAGKYGSLDIDGIGFTEKEYDYAASHGIPILSFVIENFNKLAKEKCENDSAKHKKLLDFRKKVMNGRLVKKYNDIGSLTTGVAVSLYGAFASFPTKGWVRGNVNQKGDKSVEKVLRKYLEEHAASDEEVEEMLAEVFNAPRISIGTKEPKNPKNGDIWFKIEESD